MNWFVVATKPNGEVTAQFNLERQGFDVYAPKISSTRRHARKVDVVKRPLFSGYLFVGMDMAVARWRAVNGTFGVRHILTANGRPQPIDRGFISALQAREQDGVIADEARLLAGDLVEVCGGPFDMQIGRILKTDRNGRISLLLNVMGGDVVSTIAKESVQKVG